MNNSTLNFKNVDLAKIVRDAEAELIGNSAVACAACSACRRSDAKTSCTRERGEGALHAETAFDPATLSRES